MIGLLALAATGALLRPGVYSDVAVSKESGDYGGVELRIPAADAAAIDLTVCEGGCSLTMHPAIVRTDRGFRFDVKEAMVDEQGRPTGLPARHCEAVVTAHGLTVTWIGEGTVDHLRRRRRPFALALPQSAPVLEADPPRD